MYGVPRNGACSKEAFERDAFAGRWVHERHALRVEGEVVEAELGTRRSGFKRPLRSMKHRRGLLASCGDPNCAVLDAMPPPVPRRQGLCFYLRSRADGCRKSWSKRACRAFPTRPVSCRRSESKASDFEPNRTSTHRVPPLGAIPIPFSDS